MTITQLLLLIKQSADDNDYDALMKLSEKIGDMLLPLEDKDALQAMVDMASQLMETLDEMQEMSMN